MFGKISALAVSGALLFSAHTAQAQTETPAENSAQQWAAQCTDWDEWDKPAPPFRIHGDTYYVGTCGIAAILITSAEGHVLIDSGTEAGAEVVLNNIRALGFDPADVMFILASHEHHDHVGGVALLQAESGAIVFAGEPAVSALSEGTAQEGDPQFGELPDFAPIQGVIGLSDGEWVTVGADGVTFQAIATPGHTAGALSWQWQSCETDGCLSIVYADSLSAVSSDTYRFSDHPEYLAAYREGVERLAALDCDLLLTPHPTSSNLRSRLIGEAPMVDPASCRDYAALISSRLDARLAQEAEQSGTHNAD